MEEFDIYLVSNGSMNIYPNNSLSSFTNLLAQPLHLDGDWSVALAEITFPAIVKNVKRTKITRHWGVDWDNIKADTLIRPRHTTHYVQEGYYRSIESIVNTIGGVLGEDVRHEIDDQQRLQVVVPTNNLFVFDPPDLLRMCGYTTPKWGRLQIIVENQVAVSGFPERDLVRIRNIAKTDYPYSNDRAEFPFDISGNTHLIFVYINIIEYQPVGDSKAPLLRLIPLQRTMKNNELEDTKSLDYRSFDNLQFKKLLSTNVGAIQIELRNESGDLVPFISLGKTALTLRFRRNHLPSKY